MILYSMHATKHMMSLMLSSLWQQKPWHPSAAASRSDKSSSASLDASVELQPMDDIMQSTAVPKPSAAVCKLSCTGCNSTCTSRVAELDSSHLLAAVLTLNLVSYA